MARRFRVLILDARPAVRASLRRAFGSCGSSVQVVGECADPARACAEYRRLKPDVVVLDPKLLDVPELAHDGARREPLTPREREVLAQIADGRANKEIARGLGISVRTVETHRERLMRKLDIRSAAGLTRFAISQGIVKLGQSQ